MKSEWRVSSNTIEGKTYYGVYRRINVNKTDHSGNREYYGEYTDDRSIAEATVRHLNGKKLK